MTVQPGKTLATHWSPPWGMIIFILSPEFGSVVSPVVVSISFTFQLPLVVMVTAFPVTFSVHPLKAGGEIVIVSPEPGIASLETQHPLVQIGITHRQIMAPPADQGTFNPLRTRKRCKSMELTRDVWGCARGDPPGCDGITALTTRQPLCARLVTVAVLVVRVIGDQQCEAPPGSFVREVKRLTIRTLSRSLHRRLRLCQ